MGVNSSNTRGWHSRGYLPHFDGGAVPQFITFRLAESVPVHLIERWRAELEPGSPGLRNARLRRRIEEHLDAEFSGPVWLSDARVARLVEDSLLHFDGIRYRIHAWSIMPNHLHSLVTPMTGFAVAGIVQGWKSFTSKQANQVLGRSGAFWQPDYFDRFIRDERHYLSVVRYIENNPVKGGLCGRAEDFLFSSASRRVAGGTPALRSFDCERGSAEFSIE